MTFVADAAEVVMMVAVMVVLMKMKTVSLHCIFSCYIHPFVNDVAICVAWNFFYSLTLV